MIMLCEKQDIIYLHFLFFVVTSWISGLFTISSHVYKPLLRLPSAL